MDTTTTSGVGEGGDDGQSYTSCIIIDGVPILPPILNDAKREEMRAYRKLAMEREAARATRRQMQIPQTTSLQFESRYLTSTPKAKKDDDDEHVPINLPVSTSTSPSSLAPDDDLIEAKTDESDDDSENESPEHFASAASSTGTFIIKTTPAAEKSEGEVDDLEQDFEPQTVLRRPSSNSLIIRRKRPARYFEEQSSQSQSRISDEETFGTNSTSLSKYMSTTPSFSSSMLPNAVPEEGSFSIKINTNFAAVAKAASVSPKRSMRKGQRRSSTPKSYKTTDPDFDFVLSSEIPASAEKSKSSSKFSDENDNSKFSNSESGESDKENFSGGSKKQRHVRKLSYTLLGPSAELLAATARENENNLNLSVIESLPDSNFNAVGKIETPEKENPVFSPGELQGTLTKLQALDLGKKAHLERYLEEMKSPSPKNNSQLSIISRIESEHRKQMDSLLEAYKLQAEKMKEEFEREKIKILAELSQSQGQESQGENFDSVLADSSNLRNYYVANKVPSTPVQFSPQKFEIFQEKSPAIEKFSAVGISKFQYKLANLSKTNPTLKLKQGVDIRSPLLKGLIFPDPLERLSISPKIPKEAYDPANKPKFERLSSAAKGYLTRRLLHCEKIQNIIRTIRDTIELLLNLQEEDEGGEIQIREEDRELHHRLLQQLTGAHHSFHDLFFKISTKEQMAIIANDRENIRSKALRNVLSRRGGISPTKPNISSATLKSIERRATQSRSPGAHRKESHSLSSRARRSSMRPVKEGQSYSVKPKPTKSFNISPKRRRMTLLNGNGKAKGLNVTTRSTRPFSATVSQSNSKVSAPVPTSYSARAVTSAQTQAHPGWGSDTFLVPNEAWRKRNLNSSNRASGRLVAELGTIPSNRVAGVQQRSSLANRQPWKK